MALDRLEALNAMEETDDDKCDSEASDGNGVQSLCSIADEDLGDEIEALFGTQCATIQQSLLDFQLQARTWLAKRRGAILHMEAELEDLRAENQILRDRCASVGVAVETTRQSETGGTGEACEASSSTAAAISSTVTAHQKQKRKKAPQNSNLKTMLREQQPISPVIPAPVSPPGLPPDLSAYSVYRPKESLPKLPAKVKSNIHAGGNLPSTIDTMPGAVQNEDDDDDDEDVDLSTVRKHSVTASDDSMYEHVTTKGHKLAKNVVDDEEISDERSRGKANMAEQKESKPHMASHSRSADNDIRDANNRATNFTMVVPQNRDSLQSEGTVATEIVSGDSNERHSGPLYHRTRAQQSLFSAGRLPSKIFEGFDQDEEARRRPQAIFADAAAMKDRVRQAVVREPYNVHDLYHKKGTWQWIARSQLFEHTTLFVIFVNACWIAVDTDYNKAETVMDSTPVFQFAENFFCTYFTFEWIVRFMSFKNKRTGFHDAWFVFDTGLWVLMVTETWLMYVIIFVFGGGNSSSISNASVLRLFRILRLSRMARMARLLRAMPELMILLKGIKVAMRSVFFTLCLLMLIIYVFAVGFTQALSETDAGEKVFKSVPDSVNALLLRGVLPDQEDLVETVGQQHFIYRCLMLVYILLASLTGMNMLVGVLVEVVSVVSSVEKETLLVNYVKTQLQPMLYSKDGHADYNTKIGKDDFVQLLEQPEAARALQDVGVDVVNLVDFTDFIFKEAGKELSFSDCMDVVLQLRGTNASTVKDIVDLRKQVLDKFLRLEEQAQERHEILLELFVGRKSQYSPGRNARPNTKYGTQQLQDSSTSGSGTRLQTVSSNSFLCLE